MFDFVRYVVRNKAYTVSKARHAYATHKAMRHFKKSHPVCAWCGRSRRLDVHHIIPVSVDVSLAASEGNMLMLCRKPQCHLIVGHNGNYARRYIENLKELCTKNRVVRTTKHA